jgi:hypothetical protein
MGQFVARQHSIMIGVEQIEPLVRGRDELPGTDAAIEIGVGRRDRLGQIEIGEARGAFAGGVITLGRRES